MRMNREADAILESFWGKYPTGRKYDILCKCITAFHLARGFYSGCYGSYGRFDSEDKRLVYIGRLAESFRAVFLRIGMDRLGTTPAGAQSLRSLLEVLATLASAATSVS